ncbi:PepSY domain-containing protein [Streptomyces canus]|uniref:Membrane protein YkoI n=1 Tax=Streptomyces canus TaxID=58343 RepID=A0AAW8FCP5_9ACTN|nr:PepSY domain-containing protein [Streptomyces canus]MDQ0763971.1 putative membrane protein YkoI [Streptomyces canus]MDQ0907572.1 putative membrane protein YkoI [Streptomyces canus]
MKRNIVIATLTAAALATGGTVAAFAAGDDEATATQRQTNTSAQAAADHDDADDAADDRDDDATEDRTAVRGADVTAAEAIAAALKHTPGTAVSADLDDDGDDAWKVSVVKGDGTEYDVRIAPDSGKVLGAQRDTDDDHDGDDRAELAAVKRAKTDAREAALAAAHKGTVTEVGIDDDNGTVAWSAETVKGNSHGEWNVALDTGKVTQDRDDDGDDA